jgi:hypothetical protein
MSVESRKTEIKNVFNNWKLKKSSVVKNKSSFTNPNLIRFSDRDVLKITEKWRTIKTPSNRSGNSVDVFNHEWSEQFKTYEFNECKESNTLTNNKSFWSDEVCNLISTHKDDFDSEEEYESRLNECLEISNKYN